jgi:hypothetical protein
MATITFDTLQYVEKLKSGGFTDQQAKVMAEAQKQAIDTAADATLATKADILSVRKDVEQLERKLIEHDAKFTLLQWMIGATLATTTASLWMLMRVLSGAH